jgi:hypothetical protein
MLRSYVPLPAGAGAPTVRYDYDGLSLATGPFGKGRPACGSAGLQLFSMGNYNRVIIRGKDGHDVWFIKSEGVYQAGAASGEQLTCDNPSSPTCWWHRFPDSAYYIYGGAGASAAARPYYEFDRNGNCTYFFYDSNRVVRIQDSVGRSTYFTYGGADTKVASVKDCRDAVTSSDPCEPRAPLGARDVQ